MIAKAGMSLNANSLLESVGDVISLQPAIKAANVDSIDANNLYTAVEDMLEVLLAKEQHTYLPFLSGLRKALSDGKLKLTPKLLDELHRFNFIARAVENINPDPLAAYASYFNGRSIEDVAKSSPAMQKLLDQFLEVHLKDVHGSVYKANEVKNMLKCSPEWRANYFAAKTGLVEAQEEIKQIRLLMPDPEIMDTYKTQIMDAYKTLYGKEFAVTPKVHKEHGYNIFVPRRNVTNSSFTVPESNKQWQGRARLLAQIFADNFTSGITIPNENFNNGRIIVYVEKGSVADKFFANIATTECLKERGSARLWGER
jgi:hypothetical protein